MKVYPVEFYKKRNLLGFIQWRWRISGQNKKTVVAISSESFWRKGDCVHNAELTMVALREHFKKEFEHEQFMKGMPSHCIDHKPSQCRLSGICQECTKPQ